MRSGIRSFVLSAALIEISFLVVLGIVRLLLRHAAVDRIVLDNLDLAAICGGLAVIWTAHCANATHKGK